MVTGLSLLWPLSSGTSCQWIYVLPTLLPFLKPNLTRPDWRLVYIREVTFYTLCLQNVNIFILPPNSLCSIPCCGDRCFPLEGYYLQSLDLDPSVLSSNQENFPTPHQGSASECYGGFDFWGADTFMCVNWLTMPISQRPCNN